MPSLTQILGLGCNFTEKFNKVWKVISHELCTNNQILSGVVGDEFRAEELAFADDADC